MRSVALLKPLVAFAVSFVVAVALGEGVVRLLGVQGDQLFVPDRRVGWRHRANFEGLYVSPQAKNEVSFNSRGLVGPDVDTEKRPGTKRLLLLGDSFTESLQVPYAETWGARTAGALGEGWELINAGVSGYGTDNALFMWREEGRRLDADLVFLLIFPGNDLSDNDADLYAKTGDGLRKPYFTLREGGFELHDFPLPEPPAELAPKVWLRENSRLYLFLRDSRNRLRARARIEGEGGLPVHWGVYRTELDPAFTRAWTLTQMLLRQLAAEVRVTGATFAAGTIPTGWRIEPDQQTELFDAHPGLESDSTWDPPAADRRILFVLAEERIPSIDFAPALAAARARADQPLYADHLTIEGHAVVADTLSRFLKGRRLVD